MTELEKKNRSEFVIFLSNRLFVGEDPSKYASLLNTKIKSFCKKHMGVDLSSLYSLTDVQAIQDIRGRIVSYSPFVYSRKKHDDKLDGIDLYVEFLQYTQSENEESEAHPSNRVSIKKSTPEQEGRHVKREQEVYVRSASAREQCKRHYECTCQACGHKMEEIYGEIGKGFIEVHHLIPIHLFDDSHDIHPINDLITLCPNCHAMIHKLEDPGDISTLKELITAMRIK